MVKAKSIRNTSRISLVFREPILDWREAHARFFKAIHAAFRPKLPVPPSDFSVNTTATTLGEARARWGIYGGASSVSLLSDRLEFDFPVLLPSDYSVAWDILRTVHDILPKAVSQWEYDRVEAASYDHLELPADPGVERYLNRFRREEIEQGFKDLAVVYQPALKFRLAAQDATWEVDVAIEKSLFSAAAIFLARTTKLLKVDPAAPFDTKLAAFQQLAQRVLKALDLEIQDA